MPYFIVSGFDCAGEPYTCGLDADNEQAVPGLINAWAAHPSRRPIRITRIELAGGAPLARAESPQPSNRNP